MRKTFLVISLLSLMGFIPVSAEVLPGIGNDRFQSEITVSRGRIQSPSYTFFGRKVTGREEIPYFEFCINGSVVSSLTPIWKYAGMDTLELSNGGVVHTYHFRAKKKFQGLNILIDRECFPSSSLVRERLRLYSTKPGLKLSNIDGKNHFIFPQYSFNASSAASAEEIRIARFETRTNLTANHMFHPGRYAIDLNDGVSEVKGPFVTYDLGDCRLVTSYEHASQDNTFMNEKNVKKDRNNDARQGVEGSQTIITDDDLWFIAIGSSRTGSGELKVYDRIRRGGYIDGEKIPEEGYYETVWSTINILRKEESASDAIQEYLCDQITDHKVSRRPVFYYNTWGMQRDQPGNQLRSCLNMERIAKDVAYCKEMGIDRFILDDGWQASFGLWEADPNKFPDGIGAAVKMINDAGMEAGVWLSLLAVGKSTKLYADHPEWHINGKYGAPLLVQWGNPGFDIESGFYYVLLDALKKLVDQGVRFFKWDAVSTMSSSNAGLDHGEDGDDPKERIDRYNYLFPFYVTRLARELKEYNPDVVVELDLTEHWRCMIGLMNLQESKFFWINNGASKYGDYSTYRTKSIRAGMNEYTGIFPPEVFTFAVYPMNISGALKYNVNSVLMAGHGFWGNLDKTTASDRQYVAAQLRKARKVLSHIEGCPMSGSGKLCSSPEIYSRINMDEGYALVTAFSSEPWSGSYDVAVDPAKVMAVLGSPYSSDKNGVKLNLDLIGQDDSAAAFVLGAEGNCPRVISSTCALEDVIAADGKMTVSPSEDGRITVISPGKTEPETISVQKGVEIKIEY